MKIRGTEVGKLTVQGYHKTDPMKETKAIKSTLYNPIPSHTDLLDNLQSIFPESLMLSSVNTDISQTVQTTFGKFPKGSPISYQQRLHSDFIMNIYNAPHFPKLPVNNVMNRNYHSVLTHEQTIKSCSVEVDIDKAVQIEENTRLQASDPKWHTLRIDRITASKAGEVFKRKISKSQILILLLKDSKVVVIVTTPAMMHGITSEPKAARAYSEVSAGRLNILFTASCH